MKLFITALSIALLIVSTSSCSKYDDGPGISLRTKKDRLAGEWNLSSFINISGIFSTGVTNYTYVFDKNGTGNESYVVLVFGIATQYSNDFDWEFTNRKENLKLNFHNGIKEEYIISRLTNKELWLTDDVNGKVKYWSD